MEVSNGRGAINSFALVAYISGPIADFLDQLRRDFAPHSHAKAHVTILPPRPLQLTPRDAAIEEAWQHVKDQLREFPPFRVELCDVEVFPLNRVIYLSVTFGADQLQQMHAALNTGLLEFKEPFPYHPHVTIVQELPPDDVPSAAEFSRCRWNEFRHPRYFSVDRLTFVQNTLENCWVDLAETHLAEMDPARQLTR